MKTMHGKCLNYKVFLQKKSGTYFYEYIYNKTAKTKKTQAKSPGWSSAGLSSCCESLASWGFSLSCWITALLHLCRWGLMWDSCSTAGRHFTPGGGILRISWAIALLCVVWDLQKPIVILEGCVSPELGGGNWHQALEQWMQVPQECHAGAGGGVGDNLDHGGTFITLEGKALCSLHGRFGNNSLCCVCIMARSVLVSWVFISLFCSSSFFLFHWLPP